MRLLAAAAVLPAVGAGWFGWQKWLVPDPAALLRAAYTEQRPFEFRIAGARQAPVRLKRSAADSPFQRALPLLEAESQIAGALGKDSQNAKWLALRAQAELLAWDPETALLTLQHALERKPDDPDLLAALGTAYALRAEAQNRDVDYGYAIEYLCRSLRAKPNSAEAIFNRALVYERMYLYEDAAREWRHSLTVDNAGDWKEESQRRLADLEQRMKVRKAALARISSDPELLLRRIEAGERVEAESYLDVAVIDWLPRRWENEKYDRALQALAAGFEERHKDRWLRDMLATPRSRQLAPALSALSAAVQANLSDESDRALTNSLEAAKLLRATGSEAGALLAEFEQTYALHRTLLSSAECLEKALALERRNQARKYAWIRGQAILEEGNCYSLLGDSGAAHREMRRALQLVHEANYRDLELRASGILGNAETMAGNLSSTWNFAREGLSQYWQGPYSGIRAQQFYYNLVRSAQSLGLVYTAYVFQGAAAAAIAGTPHRRMEATVRAYLGELAAQTGRLDEAKTEFDRAATLFGQLQQQTSDQQYQMLTERYRAEAEASSGAVESALQRLEKVKPAAKSVYNTQILLLETMGDLLRRSGHKAEAETAYRQAIDASERRLSTLQQTRERAELLLVAGKAYRDLVEVLWDRGDQAGALNMWEWFRAGERPGIRGAADLEQRRSLLRNESFVTYSVLPSGPVAWVYNDRFLGGRRLDVKPEQLEVVASRFLRECADAGSDSRAVQRDSRQLYDWLVAPLADHLAQRRTLVIEPDGIIGAIPMQALMDEKRHYLGERFAIAVASGLADYQQRAGSEPIRAGGTTLVVSNPKLGREAAKTFPPLSGSMREERFIAERFPGSVLLAGEQATLAAIERSVPAAELFHFAGHGFSNAGNGGLLLSPGPNDSEGAGVLDGRGLARQDWRRCRLAVLSACSAGTGEARGPVNPESLVRGLLWAGVARVVASRWNVDSEVGVPFMNHFYSRLLSGEDAAAALQQAAEQLRENKATSHPYFWAGFQDFGAR